jgi:uncharacterized protein
MPADPNAYFQMDPVYWCIMGPAMLIMLAAQFWVKTTFAKWDKVPSSNGLLGADVASRLLSSGGMGNVAVGAVQGELTDHYDPVKNQLALSQATYDDRSVAAHAVVAHEVGHAQQDAQNSVLMKVRMGIVPLVNLGAQFGPLLFLGGFFAGIPLLMWLGIILFSTAFIFAVLTLPVELDASKRAIQMLDQNNLITTEQERQGAKAVLRAAAFTYIAGMATALFQLLYYISLALRGRDRSQRAA